MTPRIIALCAGMVVLLGPDLAHAFKGTDLYRLCSSEATSRQLACAAYIRGFTDGMSAPPEMEKLGEKWCPPNSTGDVDHAQAKLIIQKFMTDHPDRLHFDAAVISANALYEAFPCR